jgi:hypothetical protein
MCEFYNKAGMGLMFKWFDRLKWWIFTTYLELLHLLDI